MKKKGALKVNYFIIIIIIIIIIVIMKRRRRRNDFFSIVHFQLLTAHICVLKKMGGGEGGIGVIKEPYAILAQK